MPAPNTKNNCPTLVPDFPSLLGAVRPRNHKPPFAAPNQQPSDRRAAPFKDALAPDCTDASILHSTARCRRLSSCVMESPFVVHPTARSICRLRPYTRAPFTTLSRPSSPAPRELCRLRPRYAATFALCAPTPSPTTAHCGCAVATAAFRASGEAPFCPLPYARQAPGHEKKRPRSRCCGGAGMRHMDRAICLRQ